MEPFENKRPTVPWFLVLAAALGWIGLIALQFIDPSAERRAAEAAQAEQDGEDTEPSADMRPPSLLDTLSDDQRESVELEFGASEDEASPPIPLEDRGLALQLVDEDTGEPVPDLRVVLRSSDGQTETLRSDARGLAVSLESWAESPRTLEIEGEATPRDLVQSSRPPQRLLGEPIAVTLDEDRDPGLPVEVAVPVGPTWTLDLVGMPPGLAAHELDAVLASADAAKAFDKVYAKVRPGAPPWLRFGPLARLVTPGPPWRVTLTSDDGLWSGSALVDRVSGADTTPLVVELDSRARVHGLLHDADGAPVASSYVQLWPEASVAADSKKRPSFALTDEQGQFDFRGLEPNTYALKVAVTGHEPYEEPLDLLGGQTVEMDVRLISSATRVRGRVQGRVESQTGRYAGSMSAALVLAESNAVLSAKVEWSEENGRSVGHFSFDDVGEEFVLVWLHGGDLFDVSPERLEASSTANEELEFLVHDEGGFVTLGFEVRAATGRMPVRVFELRLEAHVRGEPKTVTQRTESGVVRFGGIPPRTPFTWTLRADEHAVHWGEGVAPAEDRSEVLNPPRGFGLELQARSSKGEPLAGAQVLFDDVLVATCDEHGRARIQTEEAPAKIRVEHLDWVPSEASQVRADGSWEARKDRLTAILEAPPQ